MRVDLLVGEAVGLQVREAPVGVAEIRPRRRRRAVGLDRLRHAGRPSSARAPIDRCTSGELGRRRRAARGRCAIARSCSPRPTAAVAAQRAVVGVARARRPAAARVSLARLRVLVPLRPAPRRSRSARPGSRARAPAPPRAAVSASSSTSRAMPIRASSRIASGWSPWRSRKARIDLLGRPEVAVGEQRRSPSPPPAAGALSVATCAAAVAAFCGVAGQPVEALEHAPARRQRRIDVDGAQQRLDRPRRILQRDVAEAALLVQPAEARVQRARAARASRARRRCAAGGAG